MGRIRLTSEEKEKLLQGIEEAQRKLDEHQGELTEEDAFSLLRESLGDAVYYVLKNHKSERLLT